MIYRREVSYHPHYSTAQSPDIENFKAEVIADYDAKSADELTVRVGETIEITDKEKDSSGWWKVNKMV